MVDISNINIRLNEHQLDLLTAIANENMNETPRLSEGRIIFDLIVITFLIQYLFSPSTFITVERLQAKMLAPSASFIRAQPQLQVLVDFYRSENIAVLSRFFYPIIGCFQVCNESCIES